MVSEQNTTDAADLQSVLDALTSPVRREILRLIWDDELAAGDIAAAFALTKPTISQHLSVMRRAGLVSVRAVGTSRLYQARQAVLRAASADLASDAKWRSADDLPERQLSGASTKFAVVAEVDVSTDQATTFRAFADPDLYTRWLGVPVTIEEGRFACTMEWGTRVRGRYEVVCPPDLIAMRWDFDDDNVPVPGGEMVGYLRLAPTMAVTARGRRGRERSGEGGCHVEVHQLVDTEEQARFMVSAWRMVLGRLKAGVVDAVADGPVEPRAERPKQTGPAPAG